MDIKVAMLEYRIDDDLPTSFGRKLRGFFANKFEDELFHQHSEEGKPLYNYPLIQYKIIRGNPLIVALSEGCEKLTKSFIEVEKIKLGDRIYTQPEGNLEVNHFSLEISQAEAMPENKYEFITPWLGLNQNNYEVYKEKREKWNEVEEKKFLSKILVGNILSFGKGIDWWIEEKIIVVPEFEDISVSFKGKDMVGFTGDFYTNVSLPDFIGLGQATSRGFGTISQAS